MSPDHEPHQDPADDGPPETADTAEDDDQEGGDHGIDADVGPEPPDRCEHDSREAGETGADAEHHPPAVPEKPLDRPRLGRGFDDDDPHAAANRAPGPPCPNRPSPPLQATIAHAVRATRAAIIPPNRRVLAWSQVDMLRKRRAPALHSSGGLTVSITGMK